MSPYASERLDETQYQTMRVWLVSNARRALLEAAIDRREREP